MSKKFSQESDLIFIIRHIILMEAILGGITILLAIVGGIFLLLDVQPLATEIDSQIQIVLQNPVYGIISSLAVISLGIGGILCFFGLLSIFSSSTEGLSAESYSGLRPDEVNRLQRARLSWMARNVSSIVLGICFIVQSVLLFVMSYPT